MRNLSPDSKHYLTLFAGSVAYFAWFGGLVGLRTEHVFLYFLLVGAYYVHPSARRVVVAFAPFVVYWIMYDSMRIFPNYEVNPVHVAEPYYFEKQWFGINTPEGRLTWNEFFKERHIPALDIVTGFFYLSWVPIPLIFALWLLYNNKPLFLKFSYCFLYVNIIGIIIYYLYPAAPPWYVEQYGFDLIYNTPGNSAGLSEFDRLLDVKIFAGMYSKNASVFAAIPSLHAAFPVMCLLYGWRLRKKWLNLFFAILVAGIWFSAVYSRHHYIIDVLLGGAVAVFSYFTFEYLSEKTFLKRRLEELEQQI
ncbi:MAG: phosphatase PAP2 family protein [Saprospiraceae bacterium]